MVGMIFIITEIFFLSYIKNERSEILNSYEKALQKIAQDSKCKPQCMGAIIGPTGPTGPAGMGITGPTGPQGPVSVTVGTTTTGAPGSQASVTNTGTVDDVVLSFTIPEGPTGPTGDTGATETYKSVSK